MTYGCRERRWVLTSQRTRRQRRPGCARCQVTPRRQPCCRSPSPWRRSPKGQRRRCGGIGRLLRCRHCSTARACPISARRAEVPTCLKRAGGLCRPVCSIGRQRTHSSPCVPVSCGVGRGEAAWDWTHGARGLLVCLQRGMQVCPHTPQSAPNLLCGKCLFYQHMHVVHLKQQSRRRHVLSVK